VANDARKRAGASLPALWLEVAISQEFPIDNSLYQFHALTVLRLLPAVPPHALTRDLILTRSCGAMDTYALNCIFIHVQISPS
jgi:hypothetical protein